MLNLWSSVISPDILDPAEPRRAIIRLHTEGWNATSVAGYLGTRRDTDYLDYRVSNSAVQYAERGVARLSGTTSSVECSTTIIAA